MLALNHLPEGQMRRNLLAIAVILTVATGCDNVTWDGIDVQLQPPPARTELVAEAPGLSAALEEQDTRPELPQGPILLAGVRSGSEATLYVVGEVQGDAINELPSEESAPGFHEYFVQEQLAPGSEWTLFSQGVRVGSLNAREVSLNKDFCVPRATITGTVELVPGAAGTTRLMGLPADAGRGRDYDTYRVHQHDYGQRVASLGMANATIARVRAAFPPDGPLSIRQDIQALQFVDAPGEAIAATFLFRDQLSVSAPAAGAYSIFVMGSQVGTLYQQTFEWYRPADSQGKGAPRYHDHLDLNGDGKEEVLLDVYGSESRWFSTLAQRNGSWVRAFEDSCGQTPVG